MTRGARRSSPILVLLVSLVVLSGSCIRPDLHRIMQADRPGAPSSTRMLAVYMPWFGDAGHMDVGYSSQDATVLRQQIDEARSLGISGFVVDWYGESRPFLDQGFARLQQVASEANFHVALMYDEPSDQVTTDDVLHDLAVAYQKYIGPEAAHRSAYLTHERRPVIFIYPKRIGVDWMRVRKELNAWNPPPVLLYKDEPPPNQADAFDGYYPWVSPGSGEWSKDGSDWGKHYLERFYKNMKDHYPGKIAVGAAWPGFDDEHAAWGLDRYMANRCGRTLGDTLRVSRQYIDEAHPLPFLLIETWNDYEEGTAIERMQHGCSNGVPSREARDVAR